MRKFTGTLNTMSQAGTILNLIYCILSYIHLLCRIDIPANRYDMLCVEGIARAIKTYLGLEKNPISYSLSSPSIMQEIRVKVEVL